MKCQVNRPRMLKVMLTALVAVGFVVALSGCTIKSEAVSEYENEVATVQRGDITIDISAAGNLSFCREEELAFEMAGTVEDVLVEVGDSVEEGQVLALIDSSEWDEQLTQMECDLIQAEINVRNAEIALDKAINPYTDEEIEDAEQAVEDAEKALQLAESELRYALTHGSNQQVDQLQMEAYNAQRQLDIAEDTLDEMLYERDEDDIKIKEMQLEIAEGKFSTVSKTVEEALEATPEIIAPFTGFITIVNVSGGDEVTKGTVAVKIADPTRFEAQLMVGETDIYDIVLGGEASVQIDTISTFSVPAEVTYISPTATISSGVVNYEVTIELDTLEEVREQQKAAMQEMRERMQQELTSGELPEQLQSQVDQGLMTQEEAEAMMEKFQQSSAAVSEEMPSLISDDFELKEGLSVTVSILVEEAADVLLVPNGAVNYRGMETYVLVIKEDGTNEEHSIQTGLSDWQYTEVADGLSEGEQVVVPLSTAITSDVTSQGGFQGPGGGTMIMPAMRSVHPGEQP